MSGFHTLKSTGSTNKVAYELAVQGEPQGTAVIAESQTAGRGRLGKVWMSPPGKGLYCSIIVRPAIPLADYPKITMTAGLAVAVALEEISGIQMQLKWPNDVYAAGKKCCGILTESSPLTEDASERFAIVGIGININSLSADFPEDLHDKVTSLRILTGTDYDIHDVFQRVRASLLEKLEIFEFDGFGGILAQWREKDMLLGKQLQWLSTAGEVVVGRSEGPDADGRLQVRTEDGKYHQILSGDVSLADAVRKGTAGE
jgi:BirA family biotin operon repressor/biotin-[acetyl-CoA-carboxylase] ligase